jgi:hypothetical protein
MRSVSMYALERLVAAGNALDCAVLLQNLTCRGGLQYKVACLNCGVHLYIELPPTVVNFQCCQCYAVHKVIQPDPALAADENRKRKRKDRKGGGGYEPRELTGYNKFMRDELASLKESDPSLGHREAFKLATAKVLCAPYI